MKSLPWARVRQRVLDMHCEDVDVVIAGAGIAGLAMAVALSRSGYSVAVLEASSRPEPPITGDDINDWATRVSALTPASVTLLDTLGVWPRVAAERVAAYTDMRVWDAEGTGEISFDAAEIDVPCLGHIVENRRLVDGLLAAAETAPGVTVTWQTSVTAVEFGSAEVVVSTTSDNRCWRAALLVGADGARSKVRELAGFATRQWSYQQQAIVATLGLDGSHQNTCWQAFLPTGPMALLPLARPDFCSLVWSLDTEVASHWLTADDASFIAALNRVTQPHGLKVAAVGSRNAYPLHQCHAVDYIKPGVALVADAAHSIHPLAGQGINLGLADARVLSEELARAAAVNLAPGSTVVLGRYQRRRKGENLSMMAAMEAFKRGFGSSVPALRVLRNTGLNIVDGTGPLKRWFIRRATG